MAHDVTKRTASEMGWSGSSKSPHATVVTAKHVLGCHWITVYARITTESIRLRGRDTGQLDVELLVAMSGNKELGGK